MKGVLVLAHGSRAKETETALETMLDIIRQKMPNVCIEHAYMEFSEKTVSRGIAALAGLGVTEIKIVPYFLFMGIHLQEDIPEMISECMKNYTSITTVMGEHIGSDIRLADILADKIKD